MTPTCILLESGVEGADDEIAEALIDTVRCLRNELYRPAVTMLGKAMEGAWIELGVSLAKAMPGEVDASKFEDVMVDENTGIA